MLRTAIVGLGSWGKTLVSAAQGRGEDIRFTRGCTRTPAQAEAFYREHGFPLAGSYEELLAGDNTQRLKAVRRFPK
jgi:predicted dehydrogenase